MTEGVEGFLLDRIAEDEALAEAAWDASEWCNPWAMSRETRPAEDGHIARWDPARALEECKAKRAIIDLAAEATGLDVRVDGEWGVGVRDEEKDPYLGDLILRALAAVYADHPDYRDEWRGRRDHY